MSDAPLHRTHTLGRALLCAAWLAGTSFGLGCGRDAPVSEIVTSAPAAPDDVPAPPDGEPADAGAPAAQAESPGFREPYFPFFDDESADVSVSVGSTTRGVLVNARPVAEDETLGILPRQKARDLAWGSAEMAELLADTARAFHAATGARMWIGDVARRGGGDIEWSVSHNSGRDADVALCYTDGRGRPVDPPDLVPLNDQAMNLAQGLRLDAGRTWQLVKALASHPRVAVQYLFISPALKQKILLFAKGTGDGALIEKAAAMLWPQGGHNDHLHVRIYCSEHDVEGGCRNEGVVQPWADLHEAARRRRAALAVERLGDGAAANRKRGVERLALLGASEHAGRVAERLDDDAEEVRAAAAGALGALGAAPEAERLIRRFERETSAPVSLAIVRSVAAIGGETAGVFFRDALAAGSPLSARGAAPALALLAASPGGIFWRLGAFVPFAVSELPPPPAWLGADSGALASEVWPALIEAAGRCERVEPVSALIPLVAVEDDATRRAAVRALTLLANRTFGAEGDDAGPRERARALGEWQAWWKRQRKDTRASWLATGFQASGYRIAELHQKNFWELVRATAGTEFHSFNAQRVLSVLTQRSDASVLPPAAACRDWLRWLSSRQREFRLGRAPERLWSTCR